MGKTQQPQGHMYTRGLSSLLAAVFLANAVSPALLAGIPSKKAVYRGGTVARMLPSTVGTVDITDRGDFVFRYKTAEFRIVYEKVNSLEYGQKAGRRLGLAIAFSPLFLLSKKRRHYLRNRIPRRRRPATGGGFRTWQKACEDDSGRPRSAQRR